MSCTISAERCRPVSVGWCFNMGALCLWRSRKSRGWIFWCLIVPCVLGSCCFTIQCSCVGGFGEPLWSEGVGFGGDRVVVLEGDCGGVRLFLLLRFLCLWWKVGGLELWMWLWSCDCVMVNVIDAFWEWLYAVALILVWDSNRDLRWWLFMSGFVLLLAACLVSRNVFREFFFFFLSTWQHHSGMNELECLRFFVP